MINPILKTQRFLPLLVVQFLGAFNDNLFKNMLLVMIAYKMTAQADILSSIVAGLFILPFFFALCHNYLLMADIIASHTSCAVIWQASMTT